MFCSKCGSGVPEEADFCHKCGTKVLKEADIKAVQETEKKVETITVTAEAISQVSPKSDKRILEVVLGIIGGIFGIFAGFFCAFLWWTFLSIRG